MRTKRVKTSDVELAYDIHSLIEALNKLDVKYEKLKEVVRETTRIRTLGYAKLARAQTGVPVIWAPRPIPPSADAPLADLNKKPLKVLTQAHYFRLMREQSAEEPLRAPPGYRFPTQEEMDKL